MMTANSLWLIFIKINPSIREEPFVSALQEWYRESPVLEIDSYAELLYRCGGQEISVFERVYPVLLPDAAAGAELTSGTTLVPHFERLPPELHEPFMHRYRQKLRLIWPTEPVFYTFRRILFSSGKPNQMNTAWGGICCSPPPGGTGFTQNQEQTE